MAKEIKSDHSNAVGFRERERAAEPPSVHWFISPSATGRQSTGMSTEGWERFTSLSSAYWSKDLKKTLGKKEDAAKSLKLLLSTLSSCTVLLIWSAQPLLLLVSFLVSQQSFASVSDLHVWRLRWMLLSKFRINGFNHCRSEMKRRAWKFSACGGKLHDEILVIISAFFCWSIFPLAFCLWLKMSFLPTFIFPVSISSNSNPFMYVLMYVHLCAPACLNLLKNVLFLSS